MTFLIILLVLFVDRVLWDASPYRGHHWFSLYLERFQPLKSWTLDKPWGAVMLVVLPTVLLGWLQTTVIPSIGELFEFAFACLVLLFSLGPRDLGRDTDAFLAARERGDKDRMQALADLFCPADASDKAADQRVAEGILIGACQRLIGPLLWFVLFGPAGAAAYRLTHLLLRHVRLLPQQTPSRLARGAHELSYVLDWVPVRLTAAGYAVAGNFDAVAAAWKQCSGGDGDPDCPNDESLLVETGRAALEQIAERDKVIFIEDSLALVWRNLSLWVVFIALLSLFAAL